MPTGSKGAFHWYESSSESIGIASIVSAIPQIVRGQCVAIAAFDSGPFTPSPDELSAGWVQYGELVVSPPIDDPCTLPRAGHDEWYVVPSQRKFSVSQRFLSNSAFALSGAEPEQGAALAEVRAGLQRAFWQDLEESGAAAFLGDNEFLTVLVTPNSEWIQRTIELEAS